MFVILVALLLKPMRNKQAYKQAVKEIQEIKSKYPHFTRAHRFQILEHFYGIPEEEAREVDRRLRAIREVFPKDDVGAELEAEWHRDQEMIIQENVQSKHIQSLFKLPPQTAL